jgi:hypothetical protein
MSDSVIWSLPKELVTATLARHPQLSKAIAED